MMPIKDRKKNRTYQRNWSAAKKKKETPEQKKARNRNHNQHTATYRATLQGQCREIIYNAVVKRKPPGLMSRKRIYNVIDFELGKHRCWRTFRTEFRDKDKNKRDQFVIDLARLLSIFLGTAFLRSAEGFFFRAMAYLSICLESKSLDRANS